MLNRSAILTMSTSIHEALPGKVDIKRHSPSILYFRDFKSILDIRNALLLRTTVILLALKRMTLYLLKKDT